MSFAMSLVLECIVTWLLEAQLTGTLLLKDTSLVKEDVALVFSWAFLFIAVRKRFSSGPAL